MLCRIFDKPIINENSVKAARVESIFLECECSTPLFYQKGKGRGNKIKVQKLLELIIHTVYFIHGGKLDCFLVRRTVAA